MAFILDIVVLVIVAFCIYRGYRGGFVKTAVKCVGFLLALVIAWGLSAPVADGCYDMFVRDAVRDTVSENLNADGVAGNIEEGLRNTLENLPGPVTNLMSHWGIGTPEELAASVSDKLSETTQTAADVIEKDVIRPIATVLLRLLCLVILVLLLLVVVNILAWLVDKIFTLPVLRSFNRVGGILMGAAQGALTVLVLVTVLQAIGGAVEPGTVFSPQSLEGTFIVKHIMAINPLTGFVEVVKTTLQSF